MAEITHQEHRQGVRRRLPGRERRQPRHRRRRVHDPRRPVGLREVDAAADDRRPGGHHLRRHAHRRRAGQRQGAARPQPGDGVPELRALPAPHRLREHRLPAAAARRACRDEEITTQGRGGGRRRSSSTSTSSASRPTSPAASASGSRWAGRSCARPTRSCSTSRCPTSTPSCAARCAPRSRACSAGWASTTVYVTHDQTEAMTLGDRVAVLRKGVLQQVRHPAGALRAAGQPVRRRLHRLAADELRAGTRRGRQAAAAVRDRRRCPTTCAAAGRGPRPRHARHPARGASRTRRRSTTAKSDQGVDVHGARRRHRVARQRAVRLHPVRRAGRAWWPGSRSSSASSTASACAPSWSSALDPMSRIHDDERRHAVARPAQHADLRSPDRREPHPEHRTLTTAPRARAVPDGAPRRSRPDSSHVARRQQKLSSVTVTVKLDIEAYLEQ